MVCPELQADESITGRSVRTERWESSLDGAMEQVTENTARQ